MKSRKIVSLFVVVGLTTSLMAFADDVPQGFVRVADFSSFEVALSGEQGKDIRILPMSRINPYLLTSASGKAPATCAVNQEAKADIRLCVNAKFVLTQNEDK